MPLSGQAVSQPGSLGCERLGSPPLHGAVCAQQLSPSQSSLRKPMASGKARGMRARLGMLAKVPGVHAVPPNRCHLSHVAACCCSCELEESVMWACRLLCGSLQTGAAPSHVEAVRGSSLLSAKPSAPCFVSSTWG